jgi:Ni,Fe-hydrogenase I large subunit
LLGLCSTVHGVANANDLDSPSALGMSQLAMIGTLLEQAVHFMQQVYFVDVFAVAATCLDWFKIEGGVRNYLEVPDLPLAEARRMPCPPSTFALAWWRSWRRRICSC